MTEWAKVVTHPLGLAGFALFLVFAVLARRNGRRRNRWQTPAAYIMAFTTLLGGLGLAYWQSRNPEPAGLSQENTSPEAQSPTPQTQKPPEIHQETHGDASPAVAGTRGDVTITTTQSKEIEKSEYEGKKK